QFKANFAIRTGFDQVADFLTQALDGERDIVLDKLGLADTQFGPVASAGQSGFSGAGAVLLSVLGDFLASGSDIGEELIRLFQQFVDVFDSGTLVQSGQEPFLGFAVPEAL